MEHLEYLRMVVLSVPAVFCLPFEIVIYCYTTILLYYYSKSDYTTVFISIKCLPFFRFGIVLVVFRIPLSVSPL